MTTTNTGPLTLCDPRASTTTTPEPPSDGRTPEQREALEQFYPTHNRLEPDPGSLFSQAGYLRTTFNANGPRLVDAGVLTHEQLEAERKAFPAMLAKTGLPAYGFGQRLHTLYTQRRLEYEDDQPARAATTAEDEENTHRHLREQYALNGVRGEQFDHLKARVDHWLDGHQDLRAILRFAGIGNDLEIAKEVYDHVRTNGLGVKK